MVFVVKIVIFEGCPAVLEGLETPTERFWPPLSCPGSRPGQAGRVRKFFRSGSEKNLFRQEFFCSKTLFIGSWLGYGPKKLILDPSRPPKSRHLGPFYTQNGQNGIQKRPKKRIFQGKNCSKSFLPFGHILWAKRPILGSKKNTFFSKMYFQTKWHFWGPQITFHWVLSGFGTSKMIKCTH